MQLCAGLIHDRILEIGAGEGSVTERLSALNFAKRVSVLEISSSAVEAIKQRSIPVLEECRMFDGYRIPYDDDSFDLSILSHVVEHVEHPRILLAEAARVAKYVFVEVPLELTARLPMDFVPNEHGHINSYSRKTIRHLLQSSGLKILDDMTSNQSLAVFRYRSGSLGVLKYLCKETMLRLSPSIATKLLTYHHSLICRKAG